MIHEIKSSDWPAFCQRLTQQRIGAVVKLETIGSDGIKTERVTAAALVSIVFHRTGECSDLMTIHLSNGRAIVHEILDPIQIILRVSGKPGEFNPIEITAESGGTIITMHPAIDLEML